MQQVEVSIIIVNYNTRDLTLQCLESIFEHTKNIYFEVIVVDNASSDSSDKAIGEKFPEVNIINSELNLGFGKANNLGAKQASGKFLLLLNSDTILIENTAKKLKDYVENQHDEEIAVVGCNILDANNKRAVSYGNFPTILQEIFEYGFSKIFRKFYQNKLSIAVIDDSKQVKQVDYITGACMFFKEGIFQDLGGFDEAFFLYYEETELCFRLTQAGYKVIWYPDTSIIHYEGASGKSKRGVNYWILERFYESKNLYYKKCHGNLLATFIKYFSIPKTLIMYRKFNTTRILCILLKTGSRN